MKNKRLIQMIKNSLASGTLLVTAISSLTCITAARADQQIQDDLIVTGSICAGFDCANGETFNFDTLRLKENNLRIKFIDTSSSSSFPTVDWEIVVNDSVNGGLNRFSIAEKDSGNTPFTILQSAPNNSVVVTASGNVGFGTLAPLVELQIQDGNSPTIRLHQDGTSGFAEQIWDIGGNETNFFIRDYSNSSSLPFRLSPNAPNSSIHIASDGDVGFETSTPDGQFDVAHSADANNHAFLISPVSYVGVNIDNGFVPRGPFDVQTTGGVSRFMVQSDGKVGIGLGTTGAAAGLFDVQLSGNSKFTVDSVGDVGINTNVPADVFEVKTKTDSKSRLLVKDIGAVEVKGVNWGGGPADPTATGYLGVPQTVMLDVKNEDNTSRFVVTNAGNVGIGTITPVAGVHVSASNGTAKIKIEETAGVANQALLELVNDKAVRAYFRNSTQTPEVWAIRHNGNFEIASMDDGTPEFQILPTGDVYINGTLTHASDVNGKENFKVVDGQEILTKLEEMPISSWNYKDNDQKVRHLGPMAQDFYAKFGLGLNDKGIATLDVGGVALAGIKELYKTIQEKNQIISSNEKRIIELEKLVRKIALNKAN